MKNFKEYLSNIYDGVKSTIVGMMLTIKYFFKKKVTIEYPEKKDIIPPSFRGMHKYNKSKCLACGACVRACPVSCIKINAEGKGKDANIKSFQIDYGRCTFCGMCEEACNTCSLILGNNFDISVNKRYEAIVDFAKEDSELYEVKEKNLEKNNDKNEGM